MNKNTSPFINEIALQQSFSPALTPVGRNVDYLRGKREVEDIDKLLICSGVESQAVQCVLQ